MTWRKVFSPPAEVSKADTGLRFTDVLFGFVISELFVRLQAAGGLPWFVRWQLIAGTALVLGSWIGFRRSVNRTDYEVKFFNYPFWRFVLDQLMVILYFKVAVVTARNPNSVDYRPTDMIDQTAQILLIIFGLYAFWDLLGIRMASVRNPDGSWKYSKIDEDDNQTGVQNRRDWLAFGITLGALAALVAIWRIGEALEVNSTEASWLLAGMTLVLVAYRFVKEVKNTVLASRSAPSSDATIRGPSTKERGGTS